MAIPGVTPTSQLLSLTDQSDDGSIGALLGYGSAAEKAYRQSLAGQAAPRFGKGGVQLATLAPFNPIFSLADDDQADDDQTVPVTSPNNLPVQDGSNQSFTNVTQPIVDTATGALQTAQSLVQQPKPGDVTYGALTSFVQDKIGDANIDVPGVGNVNVPNTAVNTLVDVALPVVPGLGLVSSLINPTMVETSWGTPFNTGGGGLMGIAGQLSLNNLENIYSETQAGTEGYDFYAPGSLPGVNTPIGISPGFFGFGSVVSGNKDMLPSQADTNKDGEISASEVLAYTDPDSQGRKDFQTFTDNKKAAQEARAEYEKQLKESGGAGFVGGSVITDSKGNPVTSTNPATGEKIPAISGGTYVDYGALPKEGTSATTESTGNFFSDLGSAIGGLFGIGGDDKTAQTETETKGDITSQGIMDAITGGMQRAKDDPRPSGTFEVASSDNITSDAVTSSDSGSGGLFSGGGSDGVGNLGAVGDFFGGIGDALGITNYSEPDPEPAPSSSNDDNDSGGGGGGGSICFLTTAVVGMRGEADDCPTLTKLRSFRDNYMKGMQNEVEEYYAIAPKIVEAIPKSHDDWHWIGDQIDLSVMFIDSGDDDSAYETYKDMVQTLKQNWLKEA